MGLSDLCGMTIVAITPADARLSLPQALLAYWLPHRDALPRDAVYAPGKSAEEVENEDADMMETAQDDAVVAALRAADARAGDPGGDADRAARCRARAGSVRAVTRVTLSGRSAPRAQPRAPADRDGGPSR